MKNNKHIFFAIIAALMLGLTSVKPAQAQIILTEQDEYSSRVLVNGPEFSLPDLPNHDSTYDYFYAPVAGGVWVLSALGLVYLAGKRKKEE